MFAFPRTLFNILDLDQAKLLLAKKYLFTDFYSREILKITLFKLKKKTYMYLKMKISFQLFNL